MIKIKQLFVGMTGEKLPVGGRPIGNANNSRLVMMTHDPAASIGELMKIPFSRPRDRTRTMEDPEYKLRNYALDFLYHRFAHDDTD